MRVRLDFSLISYGISVATLAFTQEFGLENKGARFPPLVAWRVEGHCAQNLRHCMHSQTDPAPEVVTKFVAKYGAQVRKG